MEITCRGSCGYSLSYFFSELPAEFKKPLSDVQSFEKEGATLECELSKPDKSVKWMKNGKPVRETNKIKIVTDGPVHKLILSDVTLKEEGKYTCVSDDVSTSATLTVGGKKIALKTYNILALKW